MNKYIVRTSLFWLAVVAVVGAIFTSELAYRAGAYSGVTALKQ
jgi:hypothetical protein